MNDHVDEVHTRYLEIRHSTVRHEILDEFFEAVLLSIGLFEIVNRLEDFDVSTFDKAHSS